MARLELHQGGLCRVGQCRAFKQDALDRDDVTRPARHFSQTYAGKYIDQSLFVGIMWMRINMKFKTKPSVLSIQHPTYGAVCTALAQQDNLIVLWVCRILEPDCVAKMQSTTSLASLKGMQRCFTVMKFVIMRRSLRMC